MSVPPWGPHPYRLGLAGGWIDQPAVNRHDPDPPGSMVVVNVEPDREYMERSGIATSTRNVARRLWPDGFPDRPADELARELYAAENEGRSPPSGSQDMYGLIVPGITRLDYRFDHEGGAFPAHVETTTAPELASWLESVLRVLPVAARPDGYDPLADARPDPHWVRLLGQSGRDAYAAILERDAAALGAAMNDCMVCWEAMFPASFRHPALTVDWPVLLAEYQLRHHGAALSASGGGYLYVIADGAVEGAFAPKVRLG